MIISNPTMRSIGNNAYKIGMSGFDMGRVAMSESRRVEMSSEVSSSPTCLFPIKRSNTVIIMYIMKVRKKITYIALPPVFYVIFRGNTLKYARKSKKTKKLSKKLKKMKKSLKNLLIQKLDSERTASKQKSLPSEAAKNFEKS